MVQIDWPKAFGAWLDDLEAKADKGDEHARTTLELVTAELQHLQDLAEAPTAETATLKQVRQSKNNTVWRVSHPYCEGIAVRLICWFPPDTDTVVVSLFAGDKANIGDVFYNSVGSRADAAIETWKYEAGRTKP